MPVKDKEILRLLDDAATHEGLGQRQTVRRDLGRFL
jgi:hypothetical protein